MGTTMDEIRYEELLLEEWENERKSVFEALEKIANSGNTDELVKNLEDLKDVYISDKVIGNKNLNKVISDINFEAPKLKKYIEEQFKEYKRSCKKSNRKYFIYGLIGGIVLHFFPDLILFIETNWIPAFAGMTSFVL